MARQERTVGNPITNRRRVPISAKLEKNLAAYVTAASAAGVGLLALAQPSEAKVVYTAANKQFVNQSFAIDLDHDGINDFVFRYRYGTDHYLSVGAAQKGNAAVSGGQQTIRGVARAVAGVLPKGAVIGSAGKFVGARQVVGAVYYNSDGGQTYFYGKWTNAGTLYVGLQFNIAGQRHYGWARLNVTIPFGSGNLQYPPITAQLTGYAYETVANKPILAGQTSGSDEIGSVVPADPATLNARTSEPVSLGLLAAGTHGLSIWRREECVAGRPVVTS
jgi:hypothetical protein